MFVAGLDVMNDDVDPISFFACEDLLTVEAQVYLEGKTDRWTLAIGSRDGFVC